MMVQVGVIFALSVALLTGGCGKTDEPPPPTATGPTALPLPESSIAIAESRTIRPEFSLPGVIEALQQAEVHPEIKALYDQEVIQLKNTFKNEGVKGPNVLWLTQKHHNDFISFLRRDRYSGADLTTWANALSAQEWLDAGGKPPGPLAK